MRKGLAILMAVTVSIASCGKNEDVVSAPEASIETRDVVDLSGLIELQSRGFFRNISINTISQKDGLRLSHKESEEDQKRFMEFLESQEALIAVQNSMENPFLGLRSTESYHTLTKKQQDIITFLSEDSTIQDFWIESLRYYQNKGNGESLRNFVYSQMLHAGPQHYEGSKFALKLVGTMGAAYAGAAIGTPLAAAISAGAAYLLSLW